MTNREQAFRALSAQPMLASDVALIIGATNANTRTVLNWLKRQRLAKPVGMQGHLVTWTRVPGAKWPAKPVRVPTVAYVSIADGFSAAAAMELAVATQAWGVRA